MKHPDCCCCHECRQVRARRTRSGRLAVAAFFLGLALVLLAALFGCSSTATPAPVESRQASYDQGEQNSGILRLVDGGAIITERARIRYNALVTIYGRDLLPPISRDYGITAQADGNFLITNEALQKFILLTAWHRMGRKPVAK